MFGRRPSPRTFSVTVTAEAFRAVVIWCILSIKRLRPRLRLASRRHPPNQQVEEALKSWSVDDIMDGLLLLHVMIMPFRAEYAFDYYGTRRLLCTPAEIVRAW